MQLLGVSYIDNTPTPIIFWKQKSCTLTTLAFPQAYYKLLPQVRKESTER